MKLIYCMMLWMWSAVVMAAWAPEGIPNPEKILDDAQSYAAQSRYKEALERHIWFHENAIKYQESLYGVRLSFALSYWVRLGQKYPPALMALKEIRDQTESKIKAGYNAYGLFNDVEAINAALNENESTTSLFVWLDKNKPEIARDVYKLAQRELVRSKNFKLCGKYLDPENAYLRHVRNFRDALKFAKSQPDDNRAEIFSYEYFSSEVATLIALLVLSGNADEAKNIYDMALLEWDDKEFQQQLNKALAGDVPEQFP